MTNTDKEDIGNIVFNWCVGAGSGTITAKKLALLYVAIHLGEIFSTPTDDEGDERYRCWATKLIEAHRQKKKCTRPKNAMVLAALYGTSS